MQAHDFRSRNKRELLAMADCRQGLIIVALCLRSSRRHHGSAMALRHLRPRRLLVRFEKLPNAQRPSECSLPNTLRFYKLLPCNNHRPSLSTRTLSSSRLGSTSKNLCRRTMAQPSSAANDSPNLSDGHACTPAATLLARHSVERHVASAHDARLAAARGLPTLSAVRVWPTQTEAKLRQLFFIL